MTGPETELVNRYVQSLFGNVFGATGGAAGSLGINKGMEVLARTTGMSPVEFKRRPPSPRTRSRRLVKRWNGTAPLSA